MITITLYGIPNCDQIKKARAWLLDHQHAFNFHDVKKAGITPDLIRSWLEYQDWQTLLNRRGTTWRKLSEAEQTQVQDADSAINLMISSPSVIRRPVLVVHYPEKKHIEVGFSADTYRALFDSLIYPQLLKATP